MPTPPGAAIAAHPLISNERLQYLYTTLLRTRLLRRSNPIREAKPLVAREAVITGTVIHLEQGDMVMPLPGDRLAALACGNSLRRVLADSEFPGVLASAATPEARFAIATGYARAQRGTQNVVLAFGGSAIRSRDALHPSLAYAAQERLGIVFVIETPADSDISSARHTQRLNVYGIPVDGNDVVAIYRVAQESIQRARRGVGPTIIDCKPWPVALAKAGPADPVRRLEQALSRRGLPLARLKDRTTAAFRRELSASKSRR